MKWTFAAKAGTKRAGRPCIRPEIEQLVIQIAKENAGWGYDRIAGALGNLGHEIAATTVGEILPRSGIPPAPRRRSTWAQFIRSHRATLASADFFTTEVWTKLGLTTVYTLFAIRLATRRVEILGTTTNPDSAFMEQIARNVAIEKTPRFEGVTQLILDRDAKFTLAFKTFIESAGVKIVLTPRALRTGMRSANARSEPFAASC